MAVSQEVPTVYFNLGMEQDGMDIYALHHPKVVFDEEMMVSGVALFAKAATRWLAENK